jgi:hypothetical protein
LGASYVFMFAWLADYNGFMLAALCEREVKLLRNATVSFTHIRKQLHDVIHTQFHQNSGLIKKTSQYSAL